MNGSIDRRAHDAGRTPVDGGCLCVSRHKPFNEDDDIALSRAYNGGMKACISKYLRIEACAVCARGIWIKTSVRIVKQFIARKTLTRFPFVPVEFAAKVTI
jgi:hypothetical protein